MAEDEVSNGEITRRLDRTDAEVRGLATEMRAGFQGISEKMERLAFVPAVEYAANRAADQERIRRLEGSLEKAEQRGHQARWAVGLAVAGLPLSVAAGVATAWVTH